MVNTDVCSLHRRNQQQKLRQRNQIGKPAQTRKWRLKMKLTSRNHHQMEPQAPAAYQLQSQMPGVIANENERMAKKLKTSICNV